MAAMSTSASAAGRRRAEPPHTTDRGWPRTLGLAVLVWVLLCAVVVGWGYLLTHALDGSLGAQDNSIARWFAGERTSALNPLADDATLLGETVVGASGVIVASLLVSAWQRSIRPIVFGALIEAGIGGIYFLATTLDPRNRPPVKILDPGLAPDASFPSGHTATSIALFLVIVIFAWRYAPAARWWVTPLLLLPVATILARLYMGAHHLTDVLTSLVYASVWVLVLARLILGIEDAQPASRSTTG